MKIFFRFIITQILRLRARQLLKKSHTQVIAVTGSLGKTTVKEAIYHLLKDAFDVYRSARGFNTDLGVALAVLQEEESGFTSVFKWARILYRAFFQAKKPPAKMVLELGVDHPGDMTRLLKVVKPHIGIITSVRPVHLDRGQFKDVEAIAREKGLLIRAMTSGDLAILNYDDPRVRSMKTAAQRLYYGYDEAVKLRATEIKAGLRGLHFTVHSEKKAVDFQAALLGRFQVENLLPAIAVALRLGLTLEECAMKLKTFTAPPGRLRPIEGLNKSLILDGSYNASPTCMQAALALLAELPAGRRIAALGTMNELGAMSEKAHLEVGRQAAQMADLMLAVGPLAHWYKSGATQSGMPGDRIYTFLDAEEAGYFAQTLLQAKDLVLVKGSQNRVRMERFTALIMAHPEKAPELLCRQEKEWQNTP